jgi:hypothetical protein
MPTAGGIGRASDDRARVPKNIQSADGGKDVVVHIPRGRNEVAR